jgi:hypothetical protein
MRINVQDEGPASVEDHEVFRALHLAGSGKVRASVDERMLSLETRRGHALDLRLSNITRVHHHHTRLVPITFALFGCGLIYIAKRILIPDTLQILVGILGLGMILGWLGTRKPTLTLDTEVGDCHTITGNDASLMRLSTLLKRLESGMGLEEARIGLEVLDRDMEFPRTALLNLQDVPVEPVRLNTPTSILSFLSDELPENELPDSVISYNRLGEGIELDFGETENEVADWIHGENRVEQPVRPTMEHGLLQRGIANAYDRRNSLGASQSQPPQQYQPHGQQFIAHPHAPQPVSSNQLPASSYHHIAQATNVDMPHEYQSPHPTELPSRFMPSFVGREGAHVPNHNASTNMETHSDFEAFRSPDAILPHSEIEVQPSLIENARRETPEIPVIPTQKKPRGQNINSRLRPKSATHPETRLRPKVRSHTGQTNRLREMVVPAAAQLFENATGLASRLLNGRTTAHRTSGSSSTQELRQRSAQNLQEESIQSIINLAESRGGKLPDHEIQLMLAHMTRRNTIVEQEAQEIQELVPVLDEISFDELKDSKTHHAEHAGKAGLPRIDL